MCKTPVKDFRFDEMKKISVLTKWNEHISAGGHPQPPNPVYQLVLILESNFIFSKYTQKIQNIWKRKAYVQLFQPESQEFQRTCAPLQWMQGETWKMCLGSLARYWMAPSDGCRLGKETSFEFGVGNTAGEGNGEGKAGVTCWGLEGSSVLFSPSLFLAKLCLCSVPLCVDFPLHTPLHKVWFWSSQGPPCSLHGLVPHSRAA